MKNLLMLAMLGFSGGADAYSRDALCMAQTMYAEAHGQSKQGVLAVAHVVKNRTKIEKKSACAVTRRGQFVRHGIPAKLRTDYLKTVQQVLNGKTHDPTGGATHFFRRGSRTPAWFHRRGSKRIGDHIFVTVASYVAKK